MNKKVVVFDFDGTITDGGPMLDALNSLALEFGFTPVAQDEVDRLKNIKTRDVILKRLKISWWKLPKFERRAREEYARRIGEIKFFPGIDSLIQKLKERGLGVGILSSNSAESIKELLKKNGVFVDFVYSDSSLFGKAKVIKKMLKEKELNAESVLYVGDEVRDVEACRKIGVDMVAVGWGYNSVEILSKTGVDIIEDPNELLGMIH